MDVGHGAVDEGARAICDTPPLASVR